jgi:hypothetical protein
MIPSDLIGGWMMYVVERPLPIPTPVEVEAVIEDMRAEKNPYFEWVKRGCDANCEGLEYWASAVDPENTLRDPCCGGRTYAEAAATAWVSQFAFPILEDESLDEDEAACIPRRVPPGWSFEAWPENLN